MGYLQKTMSNFTSRYTWTGTAVILTNCVVCCLLLRPSQIGADNENSLLLKLSPGARTSQVFPRQTQMVGSRVLTLPPLVLEIQDLAGHGWGYSQHS